MKDPRPDFSKALDRLVVDVTRRVPQLGHVRPSEILVVAGAAKDTSRATIRTLEVPVTVEGHRRRFEVTLRPLFFLDANGLGRLVTLMHELHHISPAGAGLAAERRHGAAEGDFDDHVESLARNYCQVAPMAVLAPLGHHGEVLCRQWRIRPGATGPARRYSDQHLFLGPVLMQTPRRERTGWW
ncbi:MAG: hypothetical protein AB2A00_06915 [Myxococcota bacterium]